MNGRLERELKAEERKVHAEFNKIKKCIEENDANGLRGLFIKSTIRREKL